MVIGFDYIDVFYPRQGKATVYDRPKVCWGFCVLTDAMRVFFKLERWREVPREDRCRRTCIYVSFE